MVDLEERRDRLEALLELLNLFAVTIEVFGRQERSWKTEKRTEGANLLERVAELDDRRRLEHALRVHLQLTMLELVQVRGDEEQVGARLDGQEPRPRDVDPVRVLEVCCESMETSMWMHSQG